jgi:hypothetical protein
MFEGITHNVKRVCVTRGWIYLFAYVIIILLVINNKITFNPCEELYFLVV